MITYCPTCGNMLLVEMTSGSKMLRYFCQACPYIYNIDKKITHMIPIHKKPVDDVLGTEEEWKHVAKTEAHCPRCGHHLAHFQQIQTRSADEPASIFYKCVKCGNDWREG